MKKVTFLIISFCFLTSFASQAQVVRLDSIGKACEKVFLKEAEYLQRSGLEYIAAMGLLQYTDSFTLHHVFRVLIDRNYLKTVSEDTLEGMLQLKDKHWRQGGLNSEEYAEASLYSRHLKKGLDSLGRIHGTHRVKYTHIQLYSDTGCTKAVPDVHAIILESGNETYGYTEGVRPVLEQYYQEGALLSWEWSFEKVFGAMYYIHPETQQKKVAWSSSATYVGRDISVLVYQILNQ